MSHEYFLGIHTTLKASVYTKKLRVTSGLFHDGNHGKHCITILYHAIKIIQHLANSHCDICTAQFGKFGCSTVEYTTAFLYSGWLYFLWPGVNI